MLSTSTPSATALTAGLVALSFVLISMLGLRLARHHPSDVRVICYFFSLTVVLTVVVAMWARAAGAMDANGVFHGRMGSALNDLIRALLDLDASIKILGALVGIVVLPQVASYVLAGLFGCGTAPILVGRALQFFVWSFAKSLIVASGVLMAVASFGFVANWQGWSTEGATNMLATGIVLAASTFAVLCFYRFGLFDARGEATDIAGPERKISLAAHMWMTRNVRNNPPESDSRSAT